MSKPACIVCKSTTGFDICTFKWQGHIVALVFTCPGCKDKAVAWAKETLSDALLGMDARMAGVQPIDEM